MKTVKSAECHRVPSAACSTKTSSSLAKMFIEHGSTSGIISWTPTISPFQVDSTASYNAALTVDGELLTWSCSAATARQSIPASTLDRSSHAQAWPSESQGDRACAAMDDAGCTCSRCHNISSSSSSVCPTSGENAKHPTTPMVWQVLACKPSVTDVACGQKHTLALLETGQVRLNSRWGAKLIAYMRQSHALRMLHTGTNFMCQYFPLNIPNFLSVDDIPGIPYALPWWKMACCVGHNHLRHA